MANVLCCIKHCWGVYEQNNIVNSICVGDWTAELAIIASNVKVLQSDLGITVTNNKKRMTVKLLETKKTD